MISHLTYVQCDVCGDPSEAVVGGAVEARKIARADHFVRVDGRDLCPRHARALGDQQASSVDTGEEPTDA